VTYELNEILQYALDVVVAEGKRVTRQLVWSRTREGDSRDAACRQAVSAELSNRAAV
jgi:16S rRNA C1402 (ribose-2'-O) methylase RsmI